MAHQTYSAADLYKIARRQRHLLILILVTYALPMALFTLWLMFGEQFFPEHNISAPPQEQLTSVFMVWTGVILVGMLVGIVLLSSLLMALRASILETVIVAAAVLAPVPFISLLVLLFVSSRTTRALRAAGYAVGLLGASGKTIRELQTLSLQPQVVLSNP